ncbi:MAG: glycosyltransferase family 2 protein [Patescibacteria group bacterium]|jgi:glycosyltransferase involved in cell wall biosynthesis
MHISVVIPVYNEEVLLKNCLLALSNQERAADEIIVVDNNCTDTSVQVALQFKNVRVVRETKQGMAYARDCGFRSAQGDVVCQTDADSLPPKNWLKLMEEAFEKHPFAVAVSGPVVFTEPPYGYLGRYPSYALALIASFFLGHSVVFGPNKGIRVSAFKKISPCSDNLLLHEDFDLAQHLSRVGKIVFNRNILMETSARRIFKTPRRFFWDYTLMFWRNVFHRPNPRSVLA